MSLTSRIGIKCIIVFIIIFGLSVYQLTAQQKLAGVYQLTGVRETASGFKLNEDSTFEFYFSYGALDRYGSGTWHLDDERVVFTGKPWPGKDFKLVVSRNQPGSENMAVIMAKNAMLLQYVYFDVYNNGKSAQRVADSKGFARFPKQHLDSLSVQFEFTPERKSIFTSLPASHNYFEFAFEPWFVEVFFNRFTLLYENNVLKGKHPLLDGKDYMYIRE